MTQSALWLLTWRYFTGALKTPGISALLTLSFCAVCLSACSTSLITSIMLGFQAATRTTLQSINPPATIEHGNQPLNISALRTCIAAEFPEIISASATAYQQALVRNYDEAQPEFVTIKAIEPYHEQTTTTLAHTLQHSRNGILAQQVHDNNIILGHKLAHALGVQPGDTLEVIYSPDFETRGNKLLLDTATVVVTDTVKTGIDDIDSTFIFMDLDYFADLFKQKATALGIRYDPNASQDKLLHKLRNRLRMNVYTWDELYQPLMEALQLEQCAMILILLLVIVLSSMSMVAALFMILRSKRSDIAVFKSMGIANSSIRALFLRIGLLISACATTLGLLGAHAIAWLLSSYPWITLPEMYYTSHLPIHTSWTLSLTIFSGMMLLSCIILLIPLRTIKTMSVAEVLRFEA